MRIANSGDNLQEMIKRQNELQYAAMAHALTGQQFPDDLAREYSALETRLKKLVPEHLHSRMNELQYVAMAHAQSGQPLPDEFAREYAELERQVASFSS